MRSAACTICLQVAGFAPLRRQMLMLRSQRASCDVRACRAAAEVIWWPPEPLHWPLGALPGKVTPAQPSGTLAGPHARQPGAMRWMPVPLSFSTFRTVARWRDSNASTAESVCNLHGALGRRDRPETVHALSAQRVAAY